MDNIPEQFLRLDSVEVAGEIRCFMCSKWSSTWGEGDTECNWFRSEALNVYICGECRGKFPAYIREMWR